MKIKLLFLFVFGFSTITFSQPDLIWSDEFITDFNFGYSPKDFPEVSVENNIIKALGLSYTNNDSKLQLVEYSLEGEILNNKLYGIDPTNDDRVRDYKFDSFGNLYLLKELEENNLLSTIVQKYDLNAALVWEVEIPPNGNLSQLAKSIEVLNENQLFIAISEYELNTGNDQQQRTISYDNEGVFLWQTDLPEINFFTSDITAYDNNVIVFGFNDYPFHSMITIELDGTKTVVGDIEFIRGLNEIFVDENLEIFASHSILYWLTKLNSAGQVVWSTLYDDEILGMGQERITELIKDDQGNIFVTGHFPGGDTGDPNDIYLDFLTIKLSSDGEILWENRYHQNIDSGEQPYDLALQNGFIYVCGESSNDGIGTHHDFTVLKIDASNGEGVGQYRYDNNGYEDCFYSMEVLDNDEIIVTGFSSLEFGSTVNLITQKLSGVTGQLTISEIKKDLTSLFPNPIGSSEVLKIENNQFSRFSILTIDGIEVQSDDLKMEEYSEIHLNDFSSGIYFLVLKSDSEIITKKLIIN